MVRTERGGGAMTPAGQAEVVSGVAAIRPETDTGSQVTGNRSTGLRLFGWLRVGPAVAAALVLLGCGLVHVWVRLQVTGLGYGLSTIREIVARLEQEQRELEVELAMLTAPQHLAEEARRRLDMREPKAGEVVVIR